MNIITILITALVTSVLWIFYIKFFYKKDSSSENDALRLKEDEIKDKDHEIERVKLESDNEINLLKEKISSMEEIKQNIQNTLKTERESSKITHSTLKNVEAWKTSVTTDTKDKSNMIQKQQDFIDKLTGNAKYQGNFGEKFLEQSLQFHGFKKGIDYTKQKEEQVHNLDEDTVESGNPDIYINLIDDNHIVCDSKVSLDNWKKFVWNFEA